MVQIVPTFPKGKDGNPTIITTVIGGLERAIAPFVTNGIHESDTMEQEGGADKKCGQIFQAADPIGQCA